MAQGKHVSVETKAEIVRRIRDDGMSVRDVAEPTS